MSNKLFVYEDIEEASKWYKIPLSFWNKDDVYIMQENRCVFVGNAKMAENFLDKNQDKYCKSRFVH